jgi:hypothetical protein
MSDEAKQTIEEKLREVIAMSARALFVFVKIFVLGIVAAVLLIIPITLRIAALFAWLIGAFTAITAIQSAYAPFSTSGEVVTLQIALIFVMLVIALLGLIDQRETVWGLLALGGAIAFGIAHGVSVLAGSEYGELALRVLPPALLAVGMLASTIRLRSIRKTGKIGWSVPAFVWFKKIAKEKE